MATGLNPITDLIASFRSTDPRATLVTFGTKEVSIWYI